MITYVFLGILFLFAAVRTAVYYYRRKRTPDPETLDQLVFAILKNSERERE